MAFESSTGEYIVEYIEVEVERRDGAYEVTLKRINPLRELTDSDESNNQVEIDGLPGSEVGVMAAAVGRLLNNEITYKLLDDADGFGINEHTGVS